MVVFEPGSCPVPGHLTFAWRGQYAILADCCNMVSLFEQPCFVTPSQWVPCCACLNSDVIIKFTGANISVGTHPAGGISDYLTWCRMWGAQCLLPGAVATCIPASFFSTCFLSFQDGYQLPIITTLVLFSIYKKRTPVGVYSHIQCCPLILNKILFTFCSKELWSASPHYAVRWTVSECLFCKLGRQEHYRWIGNRWILLRMMDICFANLQNVHCKDLHKQLSVSVIKNSEISP